MIQDPPRKKTPKNPGPVGNAPGHLGRVRVGGGLLLLGIIIRMLGTVVVIAELPNVSFGEELFLFWSSMFFVGAGAVSLSRPGWKQWPRGWGLLALGGLVAAEMLGLFGLMVLPGGREEEAAFFLLAAHPAAMALAAGGLLGHIRALLRPGASMRWLSTAIIAMVVFFLLCWSSMSALAIVFESELAAVAAFMAMLPLPPLASVTALMMMAQISLLRSQACVMVANGLVEAGFAPKPALSLPDGAIIDATDGDLAVSVRIDDARLPLAFTVSVDLPPGMASLRIVKRTARSRAPRLGDMVLDQLVSAEGLPPEEVAARLDGGHSELLAVIHGHPGSGVYDGKVHLRAAIGAGLRMFPGSTGRQLAQLRALVVQSVQEVVALRAVLATVPAPAGAPQRVRAPEGVRT